MKMLCMLIETWPPNLLRNLVKFLLWFLVVSLGCQCVMSNIDALRNGMPWNGLVIGGIAYGLVIMGFGVRGVWRMREANLRRVFGPENGR